VSGQLHIAAPLQWGKSSWYPLDKRLGGPQSRYGRGAAAGSWTPVVQSVT